MKTTQEKIWAGTEQSLSAALEADDGISARLAAGNYDQPKREEQPRLLEVSDGVAVISIKGSLNNDDSFWNEMFGMTGYPEIRDAILGACSDTTVKQILLDIDSGGGAVSGCEDTAKLIRMVNDNVKPVTAFTDGTMASAAYWLGCSAGEVFCGKTAVSGSIGVISTHMEKSQALKEAGIGVTVIRAGKYKALANSVEKLTPDGKAQIQQVVDAAYGVFIEHVSDMRGKSYDYADNTMAQGREFIGQASVDAGLCDGISTFDAVMGDLKSKSIDSLKNSMDNRTKNSGSLFGAASSTLSGEIDMAKKALTEADIAAIAAGAAALAGTAEVEAVAGADVANAESQIPNGDGITAEPAEQEAVAEAASAPAAAIENDDKINASVQLLTEQVREKDAALLQAGIKLAKAEEALAELQASQAPLLQIVGQSVSNLSIALNGPAFNAEGLTVAQVLAEHGRLSASFSAKFKVGGVAAVAGTEVEANNKEVAVDPRHMARVNAARFNQK